MRLEQVISPLPFGESKTPRRARMGVWEDKGEGVFALLVSSLPLIPAFGGLTSLTTLSSTLHFVSRQRRDV